MHTAVQDGVRSVSAPAGIPSRISSSSSIQLRKCPSRHVCALDEPRVKAGTLRTSFPMKQFAIVMITRLQRRPSASSVVVAWSRLEITRLPPSTKSEGALTSARQSASRGTSSSSCRRWHHRRDCFRPVDSRVPSCGSRTTGRGCVQPGGVCVPGIPQRTVSNGSSDTRVFHPTATA